MKRQEILVRIVLNGSGKVTSVREVTGEQTLNRFIHDNCVQTPGGLILFATFYDAFQEWLKRHCPDEQFDWTKQRVGWSLPAKYGSIRKSGNKAYVPGLQFKMDRESA